LNLYPYTQLILIAALIASSCRKNEDTPPASSNGGGNNNAETGEVFVCGSVDISGQPYARYWKDGVENQLPTEGRPGVAKAIWATADGVIAAGRVREQGSVLSQPCYWINDQLFELDNQAGSSFCSVEDLFVTGNETVHLAGHVRAESGYNKAVYWSGSIAVELTDGSKDAEAHGICVVGNDVYVCGYEDSQTFGGVRVAKYWLNGVEVMLGSGEEDSEAYDIRVANGNIIVVGTDADTPSGESEAATWVNGERNILTLGGGACYALYTEGDNVYIGGTKIFGEANLPLYWVNNDARSPYLPPEFFDQNAVDDIFVYNGVVHTLGTVYTNNTTQFYADYGNMYGVFVR
jgi:hypothetical protein